MANFFDQFDEAPAATSSANFFDQFDEAPAQQNEVAANAQSDLEDQIGGIEAFGRGAYYGAIQQPIDVIGAGIASAFTDTSFQETLDEARSMSLEGRQGLAKEQRPGAFTAGEIGGNIALTALPAAKATSLVGKAAPTLAKAPVLGQTLSNTAKAVGASKGIAGITGAGAIQGGVQSLATQGDLSGVAPGAIGAGLLGAAGKVARPIADDAISAARKGFTKRLNEVGVDNLSPGQLTGNKDLQLMDSIMGHNLVTSGRAEVINERQLRKFTKAALEKAGIESDTFTPEVRKAAEAQFDRRYSDLIKQTNVKIDEDLLQQVVNVYDRNIDKLPTNTRPIVQSYLNDILNAGNDLTGKSYQVARSQLSKQSNNMINSDPFTAGVLKDLRNALDEAAERSLPEFKRGAWRELNKQYANFKMLTKAISRTSENSLEGVVSPAALNSVIETANRTKSTRGYNELYELARAGRAVLTDNVPNSGTAQRLIAQQLMMGGFSGGSVGLGAYMGTKDPDIALGTALAGALAGPKASQIFLNSPAGRRYFTSGVPGLSSLATPTARQLGAQVNTGLQAER